MNNEEILKEKGKELVKWRGFKKEIFWIILILLLCFSVWSYKTDMKACQAIIDNPCEYCGIYMQQINVSNLGGGNNVPFNNGTE